MYISSLTKCNIEVGRKWQLRLAHSLTLSLESVGRTHCRTHSLTRSLSLARSLALALSRSVSSKEACEECLGWWWGGGRLERTDSGGWRGGNDRGVAAEHPPLKNGE